MEPESIVAEELGFARSASIQTQTGNTLEDPQVESSLTYLFHRPCSKRGQAHQRLDGPGQVRGDGGSERTVRELLHPDTKTQLSAVLVPDSRWRQRDTKLP